MKFFLTTAVLIAAALAQCPSNDQYCGLCLGQACTLCYSAFLRNGTCVAPTKMIDNCASYTNDGVCAGCIDGYYVSGNQCVKIPVSNCLDYQGSVCNYCGQGIKVTNNTCGTTKCATANCLSCDSKDVCVKCNSGYGIEILSSKCVALTQTPANCYLPTSMGCMGCNFGYFDKNGTCTRSTSYKFASVLFAPVVAVLMALFA